MSLLPPRALPLLLLAAISGQGGCTRPPAPLVFPRHPALPDLAVMGPAFGPPGGGQPFRRFVGSRDFMHAYLYNGDDLFPKQVNLCARGRSALLDLDLGPGASHALGLLGPAWEAHLTAVAIDRDPARPWDRAGRTRFLYAWPVVSTAQLDRLEDAHAFGRAAREGGTRWAAAGALRQRVRFDAARPLLPGGRQTPAGTTASAALRAQATRWARALMIALLERLWYSARALAPPALGEAARSRAAWEAHVTPLLALNAPSAQRLAPLRRALEEAARPRGLLFDAGRFRRFHDRVLLADLGPGWRYGRVSVDQLEAIVAQQEATAAPTPGLLSRARRELARLRYVLAGREVEGLPAARRHHGAAALERDRQAYLALKGVVETARQGLSQQARAGFNEGVRTALLRALGAGEDPVVAGSFYFETEHLLETTSGYTHVGLIKRLRDPEDGATKLWMFDRVLGFHYAYPVRKLAHSVPVEVLALSQKRRSGRRYHWVRLRVPTAFDLGRGHTSNRVTLLNLFTHFKRRLAGCAALATRPGFFFAAISWITAHPMNRLVLADLWAPRVHTGYGYRTLSPEGIQALRGRVLHLPAERVAGAPWGPRCPPRLPGPAVDP